MAEVSPSLSISNDIWCNGFNPLTKRRDWQNGQKHRIQLDAVTRDSLEIQKHKQVKEWNGEKTDGYYQKQQKTSVGDDVKKLEPRALLGI